MRARLCAIVAGLGNLIHFTVAQRVTNTTRSSGITTGSTISSIGGPYMDAYSYTWSQYITPTTVGTVMVTVNEATNQTWSTTIWHSEYESNGTMILLTRTDTDAAGTVTNVVEDIFSSNVTMAYPTNYFEPTDSMTWGAILPITSTGKYWSVKVYGQTALASLAVTVTDLGAEGTCCFPTLIQSRTPNHTPFPLSWSTDSKDPRGWLYTLVGIHFGEALDQLNPSEVSSLWSGQDLGITYNGCGFTACNFPAATGVSPASALQSAAFLLDTSTTTISSASSSKAPASSAKPAAKSLPPSEASSTASPQTKSSVAPSESSTIADAAKQTAPKAPESQSPERTALKTSSTIDEATSSPKTSLHDTSSRSGVADATISAESSKASKPADLLSTPGSDSSENQSPFTSSPVPFTLTAPIIIGDVTVTPDASSNYIISSQTLVPGSSITLGSGTSTTIIEMQTTDSYTILIAGSSSHILSPPSSQISAVKRPPPAITIGSSVITANSASEYVIDGQTLKPGDGVVISGTSITDIGGYIWLGLGGETKTERTSSGSMDTLEGGSPSSTESSLASSEDPSETPVPTVFTSPFSPQGSATGLSTSSSGSDRILVSCEAIILVLALFVIVI